MTQNDRYYVEEGRQYRGRKKHQGAVLRHSYSILNPALMTGGWTTGVHEILRLEQEQKWVGCKEDWRLLVFWTDNLRLVT